MSRALPPRIGGILGFAEDPTLPDAVTLASYGLGLWWCFGGPTWAALASIVLDEVDGRLARATGQTSRHGSELDWGSDIVLTPLALRRLGQAIGHPTAAMAASLPVLYAQANLRAEGKRPEVGSVRAAVMILAILAERRG